MFQFFIYDYRYIWPWARYDSVQHDSYLCSYFNDSIPYPTERIIASNNYVGAPWVENEVNGGLKEECPIQCRPKMHQDWKYC